MTPETKALVGRLLSFDEKKCVSFLKKNPELEKEFTELSVMLAEGEKLNSDFDSLTELKEEKAKLDGYYVEHMGFLMDVRCFFGTILSVLKKDGVVEGGTGTIHEQEKSDHISSAL